ncbi:MAG TPA: glycosyltransferase [Actinobacteria bacterium]|nr:glycosyltransferase [Actinomycetota bacterium]
MPAYAGTRSHFRCMPLPPVAVSDMPLEPVRVAWLLGTDLRPYRIPFLTRLAERRDIEITLYLGGAKPGLGAPTRQPSIPDPRIRVRPLVNRYWPHGQHRVAWQSGALEMLTGNYDVLVVPEIVHNLTVWSIMALRRIFRKRLVLFGFGYRPPPATLFARVRERARLFLISRADAIISYTERGREACLAAGVDASRLFVSQNTLDTEYLQALTQKVRPDDLSEIRTRLSLGPHVLIAVGRLVPEKRVGVLIDAVADLGRQGITCSLLVIGDGPERQSLEKRAAGLDNIHFLGAIYDDETIARYFLLSDMLVIPGRIGLTCVHGFSYGIPSITSSDSTVAQSPEYDYLEDGVNSVIVDRPDPSVYARTLKRLIDHPQELDTLRAGAARSAGQLTMAEMVEQYAAATSYAAGQPRS